MNMENFNVMEGAMIGGTFLPEKEFKEIALECITNDKNVRKIRNILRKILSNRENPKIVYENIERLQTEIFKNPTVSLMVVANLKSVNGEEHQWYLEPSELKLVQDSGAIKMLEEAKRSIIKAEYATILSKHLMEMISTVESTKLENSEIPEFYNKYLFKSKSQKSSSGQRVHHNRSLAAAVYDKQEYTKSRRQGKMVDAFVNHLGNMHKSIFVNGLETITPFTKSVAEEEGPHFIQLLLDSKNNTGWWTGGDLILVNDNKVIANIQVKSLTNNLGSNQAKVGDITYIQIVNYIEEMERKFDPKTSGAMNAFVNLLYKRFATSAINHEISEQATKDAVLIARKNLGLDN